MEILRHLKGQTVKVAYNDDTRIATVRGVLEDFNDQFIFVKTSIGKTFLIKVSEVQKIVKQVNGDTE